MRQPGDGAHVRIQGSDVGFVTEEKQKVKRPTVQLEKLESGGVQAESGGHGGVGRRCVAEWRGWSGGQVEFDGVVGQAAGAQLAGPGGEAEGGAVPTSWEGKQNVSCSQRGVLAQLNLNLRSEPAQVKRLARGRGAGATGSLRLSRGGDKGGCGQVHVCGHALHPALVSWGREEAHGGWVAPEGVAGEGVDVQHRDAGRAAGGGGTARGLGLVTGRRRPVGGSGLRLVGGQGRRRIVRVNEPDGE
mmetsp:Transcript_22381/g.70245  ORF Transcript_22381/g.70245 Transcript_22381/m.70245 type:complete len:245 (-) Transcript_22381:99-833(-)